VLATPLYEDAFTLHKWAGLGDGQCSNGELLHLISNDERYEKVKKKC